VNYIFTVMWKFNIRNLSWIAISYQRGWEKAIKAYEVEEATH